MLCYVFFSVLVLCFYVIFFFFKQKTAYEMRISDWSSDVCSSDLRMLNSSFHLRSSFRATHQSSSVPISVALLWSQTGKSAPKGPPPFSVSEIGRASCRERVCQYV